MIRIKKIKITPRGSFLFIDTDLSLGIGNILILNYEDNNYYLEVVGFETEEKTMLIVLKDIGCYENIKNLKSSKMFDLMLNSNIIIATTEESKKIQEQKNYL